MLRYAEWNLFTDKWDHRGAIYGHLAADYKKKGGQRRAEQAEQEAAANQMQLIRNASLMFDTIPDAFFKGLVHSIRKAADKWGSMVFTYFCAWVM